MKEVEKWEIENGDLRNIANLAAELMCSLSDIVIKERWTEPDDDLIEALTEMGYEI